MNLLSMKRWQSALVSLFLMCLLAMPATAGEWKLDGYFWSGTATSVEVSWRQNYNDQSYETRTQTRKRVFRNGQSVGENASGSDAPPTSAYISASGYPIWGESVKHKGITKANGDVSSSVYARFIWQRNMKVGYSEVTGPSTEYPDPDDNPPSYIYVRETASVSADTSIRQGDGNPTGYNAIKHWQGDYYEIKGSGMGVELGDAHRPQFWNFDSWQYGPNYKTVIRKIAVSGDSVLVPSQTFAGDIKLSSGYEKEVFDQRATARLAFGYTADPLNFSLQASGFTAANRKQTNSNTEEIDAMIELRWVHPENIGTGEDGDPLIKPTRSDVKRYWSGVLGDGQIDDGAPIPYFSGQATFNVTATGSDGRSPIFNSPIYKWTPEDNSDPFAPDATKTPGFVESSPSQRTYVWNFGSASENGGGSPQTSSVTVEVKSSNPDEGSDSLTATKTINWLTAWTPTETGLQKNIITSQNGQFVLPDGSPIAISDVKEGDTIMCFVEGDPGFSTDNGRVEKIRPVPFVNQVPGPGERIEPRVIGRIVPTGPGEQIVTFKSTPKVHPDDDPNAAGFDEIQQTREIAATQQQTYQTGKAAVTAALNLYVEAAKFVSVGRLEGWGIEGAIKGVVALGKLGTALREAKAAIVLMDDAAIVMRNRLKAVEALQKDARYTISQRAKFAEDALSLRKSLASNQQVAKDARSMVAKSESYIAQASAEIKQGGCFVAGTPVWMADGTLKPIEQVKVGDLVLSKNEQTGEIAPKKVSHVSVRADIWTRKLSFDNGAILETTDEHPLYVDGRGFVKAKEVGIGNSIVTRAGPGAKVVGVQVDVRQATVYNFTVDAFHSYFVGQDALWVHNVTECFEKLPDNQAVNWSATNNRLEPLDIHPVGADGTLDTANRITDLDKVITKGDTTFVISQKSLGTMPGNPTEWANTHVLGLPNRAGQVVDTGLPGYLRALRSNSPDLPAAISDTNNLVNGKTVLVFEVTERNLDVEVEAAIIKAVDQFATQNPGVTVQVRFPWMST